MRRHKPAERGRRPRKKKNPPGMPSKAQFTANAAANYPGPPGSEKTPAQVAAMARLMK